MVGDIGYQLVRRFPFDERTFHLTHEQMAVEHFGRSLQVDDVTLLVEVVHVIEETGCATTTADDDILELSHLMEHVILYLAEAFFTLFCENLCHCLAHTTLDIPVKVVEHHACLFRQCPANSGLARAHVAD